MNHGLLKERLSALSPEARALLARRLRPDTSEREAARTTSEQLAVFYEAREDDPVTVDELRHLLLDRLPRFMVPARFISVSALPVLPNGKVDRRALAARQDERVATRGAASAGAPAAAPDPTAADEEAVRLLAVWRDVLGPSVRMDDDFFEVGGDSIVAMRLLSRAAKAGFAVTLAEFFRAPTVAGMLAAAPSRARPRATPSAPAENRYAPVPLTPIQHWFFEQELAGADWWDQARMFEIPHELDHRRLEAALQAVVEHHEALRLTFVRKAGGWQQHVRPLGAPLSIGRLDVLAGDEPAREAAVARAATALHGSVRLDSGLLLRASRVSFPGEPHGSDRLYLVGHHLCLDVVSWDILLADLETAYDQLESAGTVTLPPTTPFSEWSRALYAHAQAPARRIERSWWAAAARAVAPALPRDLADGGPNDEGSSEVVSCLVEGEEARRLLDHARTGSRGSLSEHFLTALVYSLAAWSGFSAFRVGIEGHGRAELEARLDVSRTIGWFTTYWPVMFELSKEASLAQVLRQVGEQLRAVPGDGMGYGVLRYLTADEAVTSELSSGTAPEVVFNYVGRQGPNGAGDSRFRPVTGIIASRDPRARRTSLLEINAMVVEERLELACVYSRNIHRRETIQWLMQQVRETLISLAGEQSSVVEFPDAGLSDDELRTLMGPT